MEATPPPAVPPAHEKLGRILLVDDDAATRRLFQDLLQRAGLPFDTCGSAAAARERIDKNGICIVVVDVHMPDEDGVSLAQWIQAKAPMMPIVFLTGDITMAAEHLAYTVITKPFDNRMFIDLLRDMMFQVRTERRFTWQDQLFTKIGKDLEAIRNDLTPAGVFKKYTADPFLMMIVGAALFVAGLLVKHGMGVHG